MHVLVADDERDLVWALRRCLCDEGYRVSCAHDGVEALALIRQLQPDLVILDVVMPGMNGFDVCHRVRQDTSVAHIPIMFLTVRDAIADRVYGLDSGSDDYMTKPFDLREIKARVRALYRRKQATCSQEQEDTEQDTVLSLPPLSLNLRTHRLQIDERVVQLTETEFNLLHHLMGHPDELFTSEQLLKQVWDYPWGTGDPSLVRWHIRNLRAKIEPDPAQPVFLRTIPRQGYFLAVQTMS
jgi:DNA-binding response OmpR family regulator